MPFTFPFNSVGLNADDDYKYVLISYALPMCLYLDTERFGNVPFTRGVDMAYCRHVICPTGRAQSIETKIDNGELRDDDRGNFTFTDVAFALDYDGSNRVQAYIKRALEFTNILIDAYRLEHNRPTLSTLSEADLSSGIHMQLPCSINELDVEGSNLFCSMLGGEKGGNNFVAIKGHWGGVTLLRPTLDEESVRTIQRYAAGELEVQSHEALLMSARRELRHGDVRLGIILGATALEIVTDQFLERKGWGAGSTGSFANKRLVDPFHQIGVNDYETLFPDQFSDIEALYKGRNKAAHEGEAYYLEGGAKVTITGEHAGKMFDSVDHLRNWLAQQ